MFSPLTVVISMVTIWAIVSILAALGFLALKNSNEWADQRTYKDTSRAEMVCVILFAPIMFLGKAIKALVANWHITCAFVLVIVFSIALVGCQTNVNTMPNATVMINSGMECAPATK